jgi:cytochrome c biogenesis protein CcmG, thiol:disulfide interchange protein DsbE
MNRWHIIFFTILILGGGWLWVSRVPPTVQAANPGPQPAVGYAAPDFTLTTLDGEPLNLAALRGTPVVLNFWATWCEPCQRELPALQATAERYADDVLIIGIDEGEAAPTVQAFVDQFGLTYPIALDPQFDVGDQYNVRGMPTTFFIDGDGVIRHLWMGEMNSITLAEGIGKISP